MIHLIFEKDINVYENRILDIGNRYRVIDTRFCMINDYYFIAMECEEK